MIYINQSGDGPKLYEIDISITTRWKKGSFSRGLDFSLVGPTEVFIHLITPSFIKTITVNVESWNKKNWKKIGKGYTVEVRFSPTSTSFFFSFFFFSLMEGSQLFGLD